MTFKYLKKTKYSVIFLSNLLSRPKKEKKALFYTMTNFLLTPPLLFFSFCFSPPPPHTFAELIPPQVYAFSIFEYSDCYNFNEMIEF